MSKSVAPRLIAHSHPKLEIKPVTILISVHLSCTAENFKAMLQCVRDLELAKHNTLQPFAEARQKFHEPNCFYFSSGFDVSLFDFSPASFFDRCSVKLQEALLTITLKKYLGG